MPSRLEASLKIPTPLREPYGCLVGAVIETKGLLHELRALFLSQDNAGLMKETAEAFFVRHKQLLVEHIILSISRLTDEKQNGSHKNLTLDLLLARLSHPEHTPLHGDLHREWIEIRRLAEPFRTYRHKLLGHANLEYHLSPSTDLGTDITFDSTQRLLDQISEYLATFDAFFTGANGTASYPVQYGEAEDLLRYLRLGLHAENEFNAACLREIEADRLART